MSTRSIVLAVRLWTQDSSGQASAVSWQSAAPVASLVLDLITASGGAPEPAQDPILRAGFYNAQSALLMVRRLQWALQGFADGGESQGVAAAILIHSAEDALNEPLTMTLENATPGQVLLSTAIAGSVNQLPNVALRETGQVGLVEMQWRSSETESGSSADEQLMLRLIRELGREDPVAPKLQVPEYASAQTSQTQIPAAPIQTGSFSTSRMHVEDNSAHAAEKKKWLIIGGAAAAAVLLVGILIMAFGRHSASPPPSAPNETTKQIEAPPQQITPPPSTPDTTNKAEPSKSTPRKSSREKANKTKAEAAQAPAGGPCDLTEGEIPRSLDRAESYLHAGKLIDAQNVYQRLLGCPLARQRAAEGLQIVKQRIAAGTP